MLEWKRKVYESLRILRQQKEEICVGEVWFDVMNVAAMVCYLFMLQHCPTSLKPSHTSVSGAQKDDLRWSEYDLRSSGAHSWFVLLLYVILHFSTSRLWLQKLDKQHQKSVQERWHNPHGHVMGQTGHMTARQCLQLWLQVHNSVSEWGDWGKNPEFYNLLKRKKKNILALWLHTQPEKKTVHVRVQVTSHKRGHSEVNEVPVMKTARGCRSRWLKDGISTLLVSPLACREWRQPFEVPWMLMVL